MTVIIRSSPDLLPRLYKTMPVEQGQRKHSDGIDRPKSRAWSEDRIQKACPVQPRQSPQSNAETQSNYFNNHNGWKQKAIGMSSQIWDFVHSTACWYKGETRQRPRMRPPKGFEDMYPFHSITNEKPVCSIVCPKYHPSIASLTLTRTFASSYWMLFDLLTTACNPARSKFSRRSSLVLDSPWMMLRGLLCIFWSCCRILSPSIRRR